MASGWLRAIHRGVYAVGRAPLGPRGRWMAAVLAAGEGAALSHRGAAGLWGIRPTIDRIDIVAPAKRRGRDGITFHRATLPADERTFVGGIPVTTIGRTLLDLATLGDVHLVERAANEAEALKLGDALPIADLLARHAGHRGMRTLRRALGIGELGLDLTESELEETFLAFCDAHAIPRPRSNLWIAGRRCDAVWPDVRLVAELDSRTWHGTTAAFDEDRGRDRALHVAGWRTVRITARHLRDERAALAADLRELSAAAAS